MNGKVAIVGILLSIVLVVNVYTVADDTAVFNKKFDLADPFNPFEEMRIGASQVERMAEPIASALAQRWRSADTQAAHS